MVAEYGGKFDDKHIAFLDILGFSSFVRKAQRSGAKENELESLLYRIRKTVEVLDDSRPRLGSWDVSWEASSGTMFISDTVIFYHHATPAALRLLVRQCAHFSNMVLTNGFLTRGAIATGPIWEAGGGGSFNVNIIGSGYMEAYALHSRMRYPQIAIHSGTMKKFWDRRWTGKSDSELGHYIAMVDNTSVMKNKSGQMVLDTLRARYFGTNDPGERSFGAFLQLASGEARKNLKLVPKGTNAWRYWNWTRREINKKIKLEDNW